MSLAKVQAIVTGYSPSPAAKRGPYNGIQLALDIIEDPAPQGPEIALVCMKETLSGWVPAIPGSSGRLWRAGIGSGTSINLPLPDGTIDLMNPDCHSPSGTVTFIYSQIGNEMVYRWLAYVSRKLREAYGPPGTPPPPPPTGQNLDFVQTRQALAGAVHGVRFDAFDPTGPFLRP